MLEAIFISLAVEDVGRSAIFYEALGFKRNERFSGEHASAMTLSDTVTIMLATKAFYSNLTPKQIIDPRKSSGVLIALAFDSRAAVDAITRAAIAAGGREAHDAEDLGFMYSRAFEDPDGHGFEPLWMDPDAGAVTGRSS